METAASGRSSKKNLSLLLKLLLVAPVILGIILVGFRSYQQARIRKNSTIETPNGIESLEEVQLGGLDQWILIRGEDVSNPVLLWLHGGPGTPTMPLSAKHDEELVKHFVVVHWDQRGTGKSFSPDVPENSMTVEQFVEDTHELTRLLLDRFGAEKLFLLGHSWGSKIGVLTIEEYPELFFGFIGVGQAINTAEGDLVGYQYALDHAIATGDQKAIDGLVSIGSPPWTNSADRSTYARWINAFGGTGRLFTIQDYYREIINSPDYSLGDVVSFFRGQQYTGEVFARNGESESVNLFEQASSLDVPVLFVHGRHDYNTPGEVVRRYSDDLDAPLVKLVWFEQSAHFPHWEEPGKFVSELLAFLDETQH